MKFQNLGIDEILVEKLESINIFEPTPIQKVVVGEILLKKDILAVSQTGSGKTLSYLLPIFQTLKDCRAEERGKTLILAPTRELVQQIGDVCSIFCSCIGLNFVTILGGVEYEPQIEKLATNPEIIISTVGRLVDLMDRRVLSLNNLRYFILDEVDQMLDLGFRDSILMLSKSITPSTSLLAFSATLPEDVKELVGTISEEIEFLNIENEGVAVDRIEQKGYFASKEMMDSLLLHLIRWEKPSKAVVFTRSRKMADRLVKLLSDNGLNSEAMHSDRSQVARENIMGRFREGITSIIVATDIIARGIDVDNITHIFNYGLPQNTEQYIHRIGRTARAGRSGVALSICSVDEKNVLENICKYMKHNIIVDKTHPYMTLDVIKALDPVLNQNKSKKMRGKRR